MAIDLQGQLVQSSSSANNTYELCHTSLTWKHGGREGPPVSGQGKTGWVFPGGKPSPHVWPWLLTQLFFLDSIFSLTLIFLFPFYCGKCYNITFTILTIFKCALSTFTLCKHDNHWDPFFLPFLKLKLCTNYVITPYYPSPRPVPALGNHYSTFCLYE